MCACRKHSDKNAPCTCKCDSCGLGVVAKTRRYWQGGKGWTAVESIAVDGRPHVLIDPEDREQVERLVREFLSVHPAWGKWENVQQETRDRTSDAMEAALRSLTAPPRPDEPTGVGAVVEDEDGVLWVRSAYKTRPWMTAEGLGVRNYADLSVVRVFSEGVQP